MNPLMTEAHREEAHRVAVARRELEEQRLNKIKQAMVLLTTAQGSLRRQEFPSDEDIDAYLGLRTALSELRRVVEALDPDA